MNIELAPIDYYFYRPQLYTIQLAFEFIHKVDLTKIAEGIDSLLERMPIFGSRLQRLSAFKLVLTTGHEIPIREQYIDNDELDTTENLFDTVRNLENDPLVKLLISHSQTRSYIGVSFSHILGDGASFFIFLRELSHEIVKNYSSSSISIDRSKLSSFVEKQNSNDLFYSTGYIRPRPQNPKLVQIESIYYSSEELEKKKEVCKSFEVNASSNDIIMAELIKKYHQTIPLFEGEVIVRCPVDYRKIMGLGDSYFGNAVRDAVVKFKPSSLEQMDVPQIAKKIREGILAIDQDNVRESLTALNLFRQEYGVDEFQNLGCPGLLVSNLTKFPFLKFDFGCGLPSAFHHSSLNPRQALILPAPNGFLVRFKLPV